MDNRSSFKPLIRTYIKDGMKVLDLGAGDCQFALDIVSLGARVSAIDAREPAIIPLGVNFKQQRIEDWIKDPGDEKYDAILLLDVIQFMNKEWVLEKLLPTAHSLLNKGGYLFVETFESSPEPHFNVPLSFYHATDFIEDPNIIFQANVWQRSPGIDGIMRDWQLLQQIWRRT